MKLFAEFSWERAAPVVWYRAENFRTSHGTFAVRYGGLWKLLAAETFCRQLFWAYQAAATTAFCRALHAGSCNEIIILCHVFLRAENVRAWQCHISAAHAAIMKICRKSIAALMSSCIMWQQNCDNQLKSRPSAIGDMLRHVCVPPIIYIK